MLIINKGKRSFTLVEVLVTVSIMGILASVVLPRFVREGFFEGLALRTTASQIASDIRYTRRLAITDSAVYLIKFDFNQKEYSIYKGIASLENQAGETRKIPSDISCSGTEDLSFYPLGNCVFSGEGVNLAYKTTQYNIKVDPISGAVAIEKTP